MLAAFVRAGLNGMFMWPWRSQRGLRMAPGGSVRYAQACDERTQKEDFIYSIVSL